MESDPVELNVDGRSGGGGSGCFNVAVASNLLLNESDVPSQLDSKQKSVSALIDC